MLDAGGRERRGCGIASTIAPEAPIAAYRGAASDFRERPTGFAEPKRPNRVSPSRATTLVYVDETSPSPAPSSPRGRRVFSFAIEPPRPAVTTR